MYMRPPFPHPEAEPKPREELPELAERPQAGGTKRARGEEARLAPEACTLCHRQGRVLGLEVLLRTSMLLEATAELREGLELGAEDPVHTLAVREVLGHKPTRGAHRVIPSKATLEDKVTSKALHGFSAGIRRTRVPKLELDITVHEALGHWPYPHRPSDAVDSVATLFCIGFHGRALLSAAPLDVLPDARPSPGLHVRRHCTNPEVKKQATAAPEAEAVHASLAQQFPVAPIEPVAWRLWQCGREGSQLRRKALLQELLAREAGVNEMD
mmetsp:Transcript_59107/g.129833  ORF Transcript_59107/g.129833 Transcript_59107/m.129833 type:complete len:270 (-) Transcript_59107:56-865(-)